MTLKSFNWKNLKPSEQLRPSRENIPTFVALAELSHLAQAIRLANATNVQLSQPATKVQDLQKVLVSERIPVSLKRFDEAFKFHSMNQNARWLVLEFGVPVVVGISGIVVTGILVWQA